MLARGLRAAGEAVPESGDHTSQPTVGLPAPDGRTDTDTPARRRSRSRGLLAVGSRIGGSGTQALDEAVAPDPVEVPLLPMAALDPGLLLDAAVPVARKHRWMHHYQLMLVVLDFVTAAISTAVAYGARFGLDSMNDSVPYLLGIPVLAAMWVASVAVARAYEPRFLGVGPAEFQHIGRAFLYLICAVSFVAFATKADIARGFVVVALPLTFVLDVLARYGARKVLHRQRTRGVAVSNVIIVGTLASVTELAATMRRDVHAGMHVVGACIPSGDPQDPELVRQFEAIQVPLVGTVDSIVETVAACNADTVAVASSHDIGSDRLRWICWQLEPTDIDLVVAPGLIEVAGSRLHIRPVSGLPLLNVEQPRFTGFARVVKGAMDRSLAALAIITFSPLLLAIAVIIRLDSAGPAFFRQTRVGRGGRPFTMVKFRSMTDDAEQRLDEVQDLNENGDGVLFKVHADPRVTQVGRVLRKFSLDELPQLFNVLNGSMSLVGPRPPLPSEVANYAADVHRRLLVRPGLTGLWQVSGRSDLSWEESVRLDLRYVENWSPALDLMILWKTAWAVAASSGAY